MCVMNIRVIFVYRSFERISWCCVASPQSNSHISSVSRSAYDDTFRVNYGEPEEVPRKTTSMPLKLVSPSTTMASLAEDELAGLELNIVRCTAGESPAGSAAGERSAAASSPEATTRANR